MMDAFLVKAQPFTEDALVRLARRAGLDEKRLAREMRSKGVKERVEADSKAMGRDGASFLDLVVVTSDGHVEKLPEAFDAGAVESTIDRLVPGLPKYAAPGRLRP